MFFVHILPWIQIHSHQSDAVKLPKKYLKESETVISSNLDRSNLQNFSAWHEPCWHLVGD